MIPNLILLIFIAIFLMWILYLLIFSKRNIDHAIKKILSEARAYSNINNIIEIKKYEFEKLDSKLQTFIFIFITIFLGLEITSLLDVTSFVITTLAFFISFLGFIGFSEAHRRIIKELFILKDKNE